MKEQSKFDEIMAVPTKLTLDYQEHFSKENVTTLENLIAALNHFKTVISKCEMRMAK